MRFGLIIAFLALPLLEIALLIKTAHILGFWATLAIVIGTAVAGGSIIRREGFAVMDRFDEVSRSVSRGEAPMAPVLDHMFMVTSGVCLILPGLLTDTLGALLLIPPIRRAATRWFTSQFRFSEHGEDPVPGGQVGSGPIIDGEFERIDDR